MIFYHDIVIFYLDINSNFINSDKRRLEKKYKAIVLEDFNMQSWYRNKRREWHVQNFFVQNACNKKAWACPSNVVTSITQRLSLIMACKSLTLRKFRTLSFDSGQFSIVIIVFLLQKVSNAWVFDSIVSYL